MNTTTPPAPASPPASQFVPGPARPASSTDHRAARDIYQKIATNIATIMQGQAGSTRKLPAAFASGGQRLVEDFSGDAAKNPPPAPERAQQSPLQSRSVQHRLVA